MCDEIKYKKTLRERDVSLVHSSHHNVTVGQLAVLSLVIRYM